MSAFIIATVSVKDGEKFQQYAEASMKTFSEYGGEIVARGSLNGTLNGEMAPHGAAVVKFKDLETLDAWYASDSYQRLIPLRDEGADIIIARYEVPEG